MTLAELRVKAVEDLTPVSLRTGVMLEWAFLNAEATGRVEQEQQHLAFLQQRERDCLEAQMRTYPPTADQRIIIADNAPGTGGLHAARAEVANAVACLRATEHVLSLLERRANNHKVVPLRPVATDIQKRNVK